MTSTAGLDPGDGSPFMPHRPLGSSGLLVTPIAVGCAELGGMPGVYGYDVEEDRALSTLRAAFAGPFNLIDTAAMYGDGRSERRIGAILNEIGGLPEGYVIQTKVDWDPRRRVLDATAVRRSVENSLRHLGLQRLPIVYLHDPERVAFEDVVATGGPLDELLAVQQEGTVGSVGMAGGPVDLMLRYVRLGVFQAVISHSRFQLLNRTADPLIVEARSRGMGVLNAAPFASGLLAKGTASHARYRYDVPTAATLAKVRALEELCTEHHVPLGAVALQFSLRDSRIHSTIVGISRPERLMQIVQWAAEPVPPVLWQRIDDYLTGLPDSPTDVGTW